MTLCTLKGVISVQIANSRIAVKLWPDVRSQCKALPPCTTTLPTRDQMQLRTLVPMQGDTLYNAHASVNTCRRKQLQFRRWSQCKAMHCTMSNQMQLRARHVQCASSLHQMPQQAAVSVVYQAHCPGIMKVCNYAPPHYSLATHHLMAVRVWSCKPERMCRQGGPGALTLSVIAQLPQVSCI